MNKEKENILLEDVRQVKTIVTDVGKLLEQIKYHWTAVNTFIVNVEAAVEAEQKIKEPETLEEYKQAFDEMHKQLLELKQSMAQEKTVNVNTLDAGEKIKDGRGNKIYKNVLRELRDTIINDGKLNPKQVEAVIQKYFPNLRKTSYDTYRCLYTRYMIDKLKMPISKIYDPQQGRRILEYKYTPDVAKKFIRVNNVMDKGELVYADGNATYIYSKPLEAIKNVFLDGMWHHSTEIYKILKGFYPNNKCESIKTLRNVYLRYLRRNLYWTFDRKQDGNFAEYKLVFSKIQVDKPKEEHKTKYLGIPFRR